MGSRLPARAPRLGRRARLICIAACSGAALLLPQASFASCTAHASRPQVRSGHLLAFGHVTCAGATAYGYTICLERWQAPSSGPGSWARISCAAQATEHGSITMSRDGGPGSGLFRSRLTLSLRGSPAQTSVSASVGFCGPGTRAVPLGAQSSASFKAFLAAARRAHPACA
jgi:hypothetical protein